MLLVLSVIQCCLPPGLVSERQSKTSLSVGLLVYVCGSTTDAAAKRAITYRQQLNGASLVGPQLTTGEEAWIKGWAFRGVVGNILGPGLKRWPATLKLVESGRGAALSTNKTLLLTNVSKRT